MASTAAPQRHTRQATWRLREGTLEFPPSLGAGIVNVTEDSFYSGARSGTPEQAIVDGLGLIDAGFDLLDGGGGLAAAATAVPPAEEAARLRPAIEGLVARGTIPVLADTFEPEVARVALEAGAAAINDTGGGRDPAMLELVAEAGCGLVVMHIEGPPRKRRETPDYDDPVSHLKGWFAERIADASARGVADDQIALDPGFDFDLSVDDDLQLLARLGELRELGRPLFVSLSRKDFLGAVLAGSWEDRVPAVEREWATAAAVALAVAQGADILRLHDRTALDAMRVADRVSDLGAEQRVRSTRVRRDRQVRGDS